jgi:hypothetical protein
MTGLTELQFKETNKQLAQAGGFSNYRLASEGGKCEQLTNSSGTAPAFDLAKSLNHYVVLTNNLTFTVSNETTCVQGDVLRLKFKQSSSGSNTVTAPSNFLGSFTLTSTANKVDVTWWEFDGTNWYLKSVVQNLAS